MNERLRHLGIAIGGAAALVLAAPGCASVKSFLALDAKAEKAPPISNPFGTFYGNGPGSRENIVLRTKKGDRSVEVELPGGTADMTDFVLPMSPAFRDSTGSGRSPASLGGDELSTAGYKDRHPSITDREITRSFPQGLPEDEGKRREIEGGLGLMEAEDSAPAADYSYLAALDHIKGLYKAARYEAALLEIDELVRAYPTDPKLYQMRGTLLDRLGRADLALKSWNQALRFEPSNQSLRRFIERKQQKRSLASP